MAQEFIGCSIVVTLRQPPDAQIQGIVSDVVNQKLFLRDALCRWNGQRTQSYVLDSSNIADLEIMPSTQHEEELPTPTATPQHGSTQSQQFVDPAILSYSKPPRPTQALPASARTPTSPIMIANGAVSSPTNTVVPALSKGSENLQLHISTAGKYDRRDSTATATLTEPFDALALGKDNSGKAAEDKLQNAPGVIDMRSINHAPLKTKKTSKGKGWRQTPLIEEVPRAGRKQRGRQTAEDANGWATEDATDIADMGEFDFESNLSKFDKRKVFDDIRKDDTTADGERLVSFNRKARPGTNGGRNLHFTENVLDVPDGKETNRWKSEAGETEDELRDEHYSSGRGSRRANSRKPLPSRKAGIIPQHLDRKEPSPRPLTRVPTGSPLNGSVSDIRASFRLHNNNKPCHYVSPLQMLELEQLCIAELGLTEDMLSEGAGRSLAETILKSDGIRSVLFLVGNHKTGARAIAAARQLRNRRLRVTVCVLGGEREELLLEVLRKQLTVYKKGLGYVERWDDYQTKLGNGGPSPDLVVDALLGMHSVFDELRTDDQATVFEMIKWANRGSSILSIDVPTGLSASSGVVAEVDGQSLLMNSRRIVCLGAPKTGLLIAMGGDNAEETWQVSVADIGISTAAWQKNGSRRKHGIDFGNEWVVPVKLVST